MPAAGRILSAPLVHRTAALARRNGISLAFRSRHTGNGLSERHRLLALGSLEILQGLEPERLDGGGALEPPGPPLGYGRRHTGIGRPLEKSDPGLCWAMIQGALGGCARAVGSGARCRVRYKAHCGPAVSQVRRRRLAEAV
jgi:hypothetical protein